MASRYGINPAMETFVAGADLSLVAVGTLMKKGPLGVVPVSAADDNPAGALAERVLGGRGVDVKLAVVNKSREILCVAHEDLRVGDRVGPSATGRVQKTIAAGSVDLGSVEDAGDAGELVVVDVTDRRTKHA